MKKCWHRGANHGFDHGDFVGMISYYPTGGSQCLKTPYNSVPIDDNRAKDAKKNRAFTVQILSKIQDISK